MTRRLSVLLSIASLVLLGLGGGAAAAPLDEFTAVVPVAEPTGFLVDGDSNRIVVTGDDRVVVLDADTLATVATVVGLVGVRDPQVQGDGLFVAVPGFGDIDGDEKVVELALADGSVRREWLVPRFSLRSIAPTEQEVWVLWGRDQWDAGLVRIDLSDSSIADIGLPTGSMRADSSVRASPARPGEFYIDTPLSPLNIRRFRLENGAGQLLAQTVHGALGYNVATFVVSDDGQTIWAADGYTGAKPTELDAATMQVRSQNYAAGPTGPKFIGLRSDGQTMAIAGQMNPANQNPTAISIYDIAVPGVRNSFAFPGDPVGVAVVDGQVVVATDIGNQTSLTSVGLDAQQPDNRVYVELESFGKAPAEPVRTTISCNGQEFSTYQVWGEVKHILIPASYTNCVVNNPSVPGKISDYFLSFRRDSSIEDEYLQSSSLSFNPSVVDWIVAGHTFPSPYDSSALFFDQHYGDIHGRPAYTSDANWFQTRLDDGLTIFQVLVEMIEGQGAYDRSHEPIARLYEAFFLRQPDAEGIAYWVDLKESGLTLPEIADYFAASEEFGLRYGSLSTADYLRLVYLNVLEREPDADGLAYWTDLIEAGTLDKGGTMTWFSEGDEFGGRVNDALFVRYAIATFLRREATPDDVAVLLPVVRSGGRASVVELIVDSAAYVDRFYNWTGPA